MQRSRILAAAAGLGMVSAILAGCTTPAAPEADSELVIVTGTEPSTMNAAEVAVQGAIMTVMRNVFQTLVGRDSETNELVPELALSWENTAPTEWVFELREGVTFSDGTPFNAEAAVVSMTALYKSDVAGSGEWVGSPATFEAVDEYTLKVTTETEDSIIPTRFTMIAITSPTQLTDDPESMIETPIGTGPYEVTEWKKGEYVDLALREDSYLAVPEMPDTVHWVFRAEPSVRAQMVQTGEADVTDSLTADQCETGDIECRAQLTASINLLRIDDYNEALLGDPLVRQAIAYGIDRQTLSDTFYSGVPVLNNLSPAGSTGYDESIDLFPYDPDKAAELIAEAQAAGLDFSLPVTVKYYDAIVDGANIAAVVSDSLANLGFTVNPPVPVIRDDMGSAYVTTFEGATLEDKPANRGEIWLTGSGNELFDAAITSSFLLVCKGGQSVHCDPAIDELWADANATAGADRGEKFTNMWLSAYEEDVALLPLAQKTSLWTFSDRVDVPTRPDNILPLWEAKMSTD